tara:strand:+ start:2982 stop:3713 length:732 start_codon:yes stop_codon:yes gene_type:complete
MKTAICISGGIKYPEKSLESLKRFHPNDLKIFIHTWKITNSRSYLNNTTIGKFREGERDGWSADEIQKRLLESTKDNLNILDRYKCEGIVIESFESKKPEFQKYFDSLTFPLYSRRDIGFLSMAYSLYASNQLKVKYEMMHDMKFDKVVRMRFDSDITTEIHLDKLDHPLLLEKNTGNYGSLTDQFAIGDSKSMDYYCEMYNNLVHLQHVQFHPASIVEEHLSTVEFEEFPFKVGINGRAPGL